MSDSKWAKADLIMQQKHRPTAVVSPEKHLEPLAPIDGQIELIRQQKIGMIGNFKKNKIHRAAALEKLKAMHDAQIESAKHALRRAIDVDKQRIDIVANKYIYQLTEEYLNDMRELGLKNYESRMATLLQLNLSVAALLQKAEGQDVPDAIKLLTVENILKKFHEFTARIMEEETRLPQ